MCEVMMAGARPEIVFIYSSSEEEEDEEKYESSQKAKLRALYCLDKCPGREGSEDDDEEDCVILERNPFEKEDEETETTIVQLSEKLSLSPGGVQADEDEDDISIVAETGKVACRDFPHSRHLCGNFPFGKTAHENYCNQCYCYVCDTIAPCKHWEEKSEGHCHATEADDKWRDLRKANRSTPAAS